MDKPITFRGMPCYDVEIKVYTGDMPIVDDKTEIASGIFPGKADYIQVGKITDGKTLLRFLEIMAITDDHADRARIISEVTISEHDLRNIYKLFGDRIHEIDSTS